MANPAPCMRCDDVADADYFLTNRLDTPWPYPQATVALCFHCFVQTASDMSEAYQAAMKQIEEMQATGVLEQIEADDGEVKPAPAGTKSKAPKEPDKVTVPVGPEAAPEDEAADDLG
jgi:hypothetical protein